MNKDIDAALSSGDINFLMDVVYGDSLESRISAVEAIAVIGGKNAARALLSIAGDRDKLRPDIRLSALESLGGLYSPDDYVAVLDRFISGENPKVVAVARRILRSVDPEGFARHLLGKECLDYRAISAYGRYHEDGAVPLLDRFIDERIHNNDAVSTAYWGRVYIAAGALGRIGGEEAARTLRKLDRWCREREVADNGLLQKERLRKISRAIESSIKRNRKV